MSQEISSTIILDLNKQAQREKAAGRKIINATIGMFYDEEGNFPITNSFRASLKESTKDEDLGYGNVDGGLEFHRNTIKWFFNENLATQIEKTIACCATPGGTGALSLVDQIYATEDAALLIPEIAWPSYEGQASSFHMECLKYVNFDDDKMNIASIKEKISDALSRHNKVILLINDPCQNPTGFSMSEKEYESLLNLVNSFKGKVIPEFDIAYIDYASVPSKQYLISFLDDIDQNIPVYIDMSFSKSLSIYGLRLGMLFSYCKNDAILKKIQGEFIAGARSLWSVPNQAAVNAINNALSNEKTFFELQAENTKKCAAMHVRGEIFMKEANEVGLLTYPYSSGFFVSIPVKDSLKATYSLIEEGIYVAPITKNIIRVALCCINSKETVGLAKAIKKYQ